MKRRTKSIFKLAGIAAVVVVGWDLIKSHTGIARPQGNGVNQ